MEDPVPYRLLVPDTSRVPLLVRLTWKVEQWRGRFSLPVGRFAGGLLFYGRPLLVNAWGMAMQALVREPMLRFRCAKVGCRLRMYGTAPRIMGDGIIEIGDDVELADDMALMVGLGLPEPARLEMKNHITFGGHHIISVARGVRIGNHCWIGPGANIYDNDLHPVDAAQRRLRWGNSDRVKSAPVIIEDDAWVGLNATILKGVTLHRGAIVAAGAVVTQDVPPFAIVAGNPARVVRQLADPGDTGASLDPPADVPIVGHGQRSG